VTTSEKNIEKVSKDLDTLISRINAGYGTLGKLNESDELYTKSIAILNRTNILLDDINNYGMLFHLNKTWQRERTKRMEELAKLRTPKEMKEFLSSELAKIHTNISLLEKGVARMNPENSGAVKGEFLKNYDELIVEMQKLETQLQTYKAFYEGNKKQIADSTDELK
jgi:phospholipid/cholesterol/gamma-HCH transport system substrate-binding protein